MTTRPEQPEVLIAVFPDRDGLDEAVSSLQGVGIDRAQLSVLSRRDPEAAHAPAARVDPAAAQRIGAKADNAVVSDTDRRQMRTLGVAASAFFAGVIAAGFAIGKATALATLGLALIAGLVAGGAALIATSGALQRKRAVPGLLLRVAAQTEEEAARARSVLAGAGAPPTVVAAR